MQGQYLRLPKNIVDTSPYTHKLTSLNKVQPSLNNTGDLYILSFKLICQYSSRISVQTSCIHLSNAVEVIKGLFNQQNLLSMFLIAIIFNKMSNFLMAYFLLLVLWLTECCCKHNWWVIDFQASSASYTSQKKRILFGHRHSDETIPWDGMFLWRSLQLSSTSLCGPSGLVANLTRHCYLWKYYFSQ